MERKRKPEWTIIESATLGQRIAFDGVSGWLVCEDGTRYNPLEVQLVTKCGEIPAAVHLCKKAFGGEIVSAERTARP